MATKQDENGAKRNARSSTRSNSNSDLSLDSLRLLLSEQKNDIVQSVSGKIDEINVKVTELISKFNRLEDTVTEVCRRQDEQQKEIEQLKFMMSGLPRADNLVEEVQQRLARENNLIISGLQEKVSGSVEARALHDVNEFKRLCEAMEVPDVQMDKCFRIGAKRQDGDRLLKVCLKERGTRNSILGKAKTLRNSGKFGKVFVTPDRTLSERQTYKNLKTELLQRRAEGEEVVIYRGRIEAKSDLKNFHE